MAVTLDFSTAVPINKAKDKPVTLDMSTAVPIVTGGENNGGQAALDTGGGSRTTLKQAANTEDLTGIPEALGTSAYRVIPGIKQASAHAGALIDLLKSGEGFNLSKDQLEQKVSELEQKHLQNQEGIVKDIKQQSPITSTLGDILMSIPEYEVGGEFAKALPVIGSAGEGTGIINRALRSFGRGAAVNTAIQQANNPSATRAPLDIAAGGALNSIGELLGLTGDNIPEGARNVGSRLYDSILKRSTPTVEKELAQEGGNTLGQQMYDRGISGNVKPLMKEVNAQVEKYGTPLNEAIQKASQEIPQTASPLVPKTSAYVGQPEAASLEDMLGLSLENSGNGVTESGFPERVIIKRSGLNVPQALKPEDVVTRTNAAPNGRTLPSSANPIERDLTQEIIPGKTNLMTDQSLPQPKGAPKFNTLGSDRYIQQLEDLKSKFSGIDTSKADVDKIDQIIQDLKQNPRNLTAEELQTIKQNIYQKNPKSYVNDNGPLSKEIDKAQGRAYKKDIEELVPEAEALNKELSFWSPLQKSLQKVQGKIQQTAPLIPTSPNVTGVGILEKMLGMGSMGVNSRIAQGLKTAAEIGSPILQGAGKTAQDILPATLEHLFQTSNPKSSPLLPDQSPHQQQDLSPEIIDNLINQKAKKYGFNPNFIRAVMTQESGGNHNAISPKGAVGLMQLMPKTAQDLGVDPNDPEQNIEGGVKLLSQLKKQFNNNPSLMLAAYNAGPRAVIQANGIPNIPETQNYVRKISNIYSQLEGGR